jgi:hypothetical protein
MALAELLALVLVGFKSTPRLALLWFILILTALQTVAMSYSWILSNCTT